MYETPEATSSALSVAGAMLDRDYIGLPGETPFRRAGRAGST
jgi:hypothetical protein